MMNLQRKIILIYVVTFLILTGSLIVSQYWLLQGKNIPQLPQSGLLWSQPVLPILALLSIVLSAGVGLVSWLAMQWWVLQPAKQLARANASTITTATATGADQAASASTTADELRQAEATICYQASLVEGVSDVIVSTDLQLHIMSWNRAATNLYGYGLEEVVGRHLQVVTGFEFADSNCEQALAILRETGRWEGEQTHYRRDGSPIYFWSSVSYLYDSGGKRVGTVGVHRDITERKQAERLLPLAQQSEGLRLLAGGIAHDFNNILASILSQITLGIWQLPAESKAVDHLTKAARATERAAELTRQLLAYAGQGAFFVEELHLTQFTQENMKLLTTLVPSHAQLEWHLRPQRHLIKVDRGHAQQVLINLVINGAEALPLTGGTVQVETGEYTLDGESPANFVRHQMPAPGDYVYLRVRDTGVGMSAALLDRIFDPYYSTKENGSGLGLAATLGIVRHYGGGLQVTSTAGQGSTFTVLLPAAAVRQPDEAENQPAAVATNQTALLNRTTTPPATPLRATILIVDDEMPIREALYDLLSSEEMHVLLAADGYEAIELYRAQQAIIDLVLLDMKMPGMNGAQTLVALRGINPDVKVIFCSGYSEAEALRSIGDQPVLAFLQKPIEINLLLKTLDNAFRPSPSAPVNPRPPKRSGLAPSVERNTAASWSQSMHDDATR